MGIVQKWLRLYDKGEGIRMTYQFQNFRISAYDGVMGARGGVAGLGARIGPLGVMPLASYATNIGKGLREPCSPYREAYVFGAELNVPDANNWNCVPATIEPTTSFDLSAITPNHEVVVALLVDYNLSSAATVHHRWYRDRDEKLLFDFAYDIPDPGSYGYDYWAWFYVYSYIGYVPWEIYENGNYHVDLTVVGGFSKTLNFAVTGIVVESQFSEFTIADYKKV